MNWFEFLISTFIFFTFVIFVFLIFTNKISSNINDIKSTELEKAIDYLRNILLSKGLPEKWEKSNQKPLSVGISDSIYFIPIVIDGRNNNRTNEIVSLKLNLDEKCDKGITDKSFIVFDENLNEINFTSFNKNYCENGGIKNVSMVFFDHFNSTRKYYFYHSSQTLNQKNYTIYSNLLAYWNFDDENRLGEDKTQYQNNGIVFNPDLIDGFFGKALNFSSGSFMNVSSNNLNASKITIDLWINFYDYVDAVIVEKQSSYGIKLQNGKLLGYVYGMPDGMQPCSYILQKNQWYHVIFSSDGFNHKLYLNGILFNSTQYSTNIPTLESPLSIGSSYDGSNSFYGTVDEVRIYNYTFSDYDALTSNSSKPINIKVLPQTEEEVISFEKLEASKNLTLDELKKIFSEDNKFYVEVYKK
jgi:hypothetical protein